MSKCVEADATIASLESDTTPNTMRSSTIIALCSLSAGHLAQAFAPAAPAARSLATKIQLEAEPTARREFVASFGAGAAALAIGVGWVPAAALAEETEVEDLSMPAEEEQKKDAVSFWTGRVRMALSRPD